MRDVIEFPPDGDVDVNGWDLAKALRLMLKGNAVVIEWLLSPIVYRGESWFRDSLLGFARKAATREAVARHYLHLGEGQRRAYFGDTNSVPQKKVFYALRPAAVLRWLRLHPDDAIPPMHFPTLMAECDPPREVVAEVAELMRRKALTHELGSAPLPRAVAGFMDQEYAFARTAVEEGAARVSKSLAGEAAELYKAVVNRLERG
jgi:predicted nucleotidyltransferase